VLAGKAHQLEAQVDGVFTPAQHGVISQRTHRWCGLLSLVGATRVGHAR
jgi:hypothetical protein